MSRNKETDLTGIASFFFIEKYKETIGQLPSGLLYNKYMVMLNRKLIDIGTDMKLSHCWYRWGDEVVRYSLPFIHWNHDELNSTEVDWCGTPISPRKSKRWIDEIDSFSIEFIDRYKGKEGSEVAIDEVYKNVPYQFQNEYRLVRENLKESRYGANINEYHSQMLKPLFEKAMNDFPTQFKIISRQAVLFHQIFTAAIEAKESNEVLYQISEDFWFFFCYYLRLDNKCHYNVSKETLSYWKDVIPQETERYEWKLQDLSFEYCMNSDNEDIKDLIAKRDIRLREIDAIINNVSLVLSDYDGFVDPKGSK